MTSAGDRRVAVVIPAFNAESFICDALESVLTDEGLSVRIFVVDDGSTDDTAEVARRWGRGASVPTVVLAQSNSGISAARNAGILASDEGFVALLDADDRFESGHLPQLVESLVACPDALLAFDDAEQFSSDGVAATTMLERSVAKLGSIVTTSLGASGAKRLGDGLFASLLTGNWIAPSSWVIPRRTFAICGLFDPGQLFCEDREFALRLADRGPFVMVPRVGVHKRVHGTNQTRPSNAEAFSRYSLRALTLAQARRDTSQRAAIDAAIAESARDLWYQASLRGQAQLASAATWVRRLGLKHRPGARDIARAAISSS